jgi:antimicrobial peptide system SdpB family protein
MNDIITNLENKTIFTSRLAFARSLLALNALLTIVFNDIDMITDTRLLGLQSAIPADMLLFNSINIFKVTGNDWGKVISIAILLFAFSGYFPRISIFLQAWVHLSICNSLIVIEGGDQIASNLCLLLIPICLFDKRTNQWINYTKEQLSHLKNRNIFFNVYYFLILLQVSVIYLHAGTGKLMQDDWLDGTCMYYWTTNNVFGAPLFLQEIYNIITLSIFAPVFTWSIIFFELGLFACILSSSKRTRHFFLAGGILFHFGIFITHGLIEFFFASSAALILYLDSENIILTRLISAKDQFKRLLKKTFINSKQIKGQAVTSRTNT